jgi:hypothetical protein
MAGAASSSSTALRPSKPRWITAYYGKLSPERVLEIRSYIDDQHKVISGYVSELQRIATEPLDPITALQISTMAGVIKNAANDMYDFANAVERYDANGKYKR